MSRIAPKNVSEYPWYLRLMFKWQKHRYGMTMIPTMVWGYSPVLLRRFLMMFRAFERRTSPLQSELRALITVLVSQINHCDFCVDFNSARVLKFGVSELKLGSLSQFDESEHFSEAEKAALEYARIITQSDSKVDDALFSRLKNHYSDKEIVELTALIAFQNMSSKFNAALEIESQGMCELK